MALESASFLNDLVTTNPVAGDGVAQGDDHLRLLKAVLKASFPSVAFARYIEQARADVADSATPSLWAAATDYANLLGSTTITGFASGTDGQMKLVRINANRTLTHHATTLDLPDDADISALAGDHMLVRCRGTTSNIVVAYFPAARNASETARGLVELATDAETQTGTDTARAITPANLQACTATEARKGVVELATNAETVTGTDTARAITPADLYAAAPQVSSTTSAANTELTAVIPYDDTIPQISEGTEVLTASISPRRTTNKVLVTATIPVCGDGFGGSLNTDQQRALAALFRNATAAAIAAVAVTVQDQGGTSSDIEHSCDQVLTLRYLDSPATTSSTTYSVRVGPNAGSIFLNGNIVDGSRILGGVSRATLTLQEVIA